MDRRAFLGTLPVFCSLANLGQALESHSRLDTPVLDGPHFFEVTGWHGNNRTLAYADVWDPEFQKNCRDKLRKYCSERNPGKRRWTMTPGPIPAWDLTQARLKREMDWVSFTRQLPAEAPGKRAYVHFLLNRHQNNLETINHLYGSQTMRGNDLLSYPFAKVSWQHATIFEDDSIFLRAIARKLSHSLTQIFGEQGLNPPDFKTQFGPHKPGTLGLRIPFYSSYK